MTFRNITTAAAMVAGLFFSAASHAALQSIHWKAAGDNQVTLDTATGLEWLDLTVTEGKTIAEVKALLSTTYAGWRLPTQAEVLTMMSNAFDNIWSAAQFDTTYLNYSAYLSQAHNFNNLFGVTYALDDASYIRRGSYGKYEMADGSTVMAGVYSRTQRSPVRYHYDLFGEFNINAPVQDYGVYLVSDGGTSLSSQLNPSININNANSPINTIPLGDVSVSNLVAGTDYATIDLSYTQNGASTPTGYTYKVNGGAEQTVVGSTLNLSGLNPGEIYTVEYAAINGNGAGEWQSMQFNTQDAPPAPVNGPYSIAAFGLLAIFLSRQRRS